MTYQVIIFTDGNVRYWHMRPLGPQRIATELRRKGYTVKVVDFFSKWLENKEDFFNLLEILVGKETLFLGFSGTFFNKVIGSGNIKSFRDYYKTQELDVWPIDHEEIKELFQKIKIKFPNIKLVYGGDRYDNKLKYLESTMDYIVQGFAETTVIEIAGHLKNNTKLNYTLTGNIAKLISYNKDAVGYDFVNKSNTEYSIEDHIFHNDFLPLETSRGCMFKCTFCAYPIIGRRKNDMSYHKNEYLLSDEIKKNYEMFGTKKYIIVDNILNESTEKLESFLRARDKSKVNIGFAAFIRYELLNKFPEQLHLLKELGIESFMIGVESLHLPSAKFTGKGTSPDKVKDLMYKIKNYFNNRVNLTGSFIIGLPEDNPDTLSTWLPWLEDKNCPIDSFFMHRLDLHYFGTMDINQNPSKYGYSNVQAKNGFSFWKNKYWTAFDADRYMMNFLEKCWQSGRNKITGHSFIGMQHSMTFDELLTTPMCDIDYAKMLDNTYNKWKLYRQTLLNYEQSKLI